MSCGNPASVARKEAQQQVLPDNLAAMREEARGYAVHSAGEDGKLDEQLVRYAEPGRLVSRDEEGMVMRR